MYAPTAQASLTESRTLSPRGLVGPAPEPGPRHARFWRAGVEEGRHKSMASARGDTLVPPLRAWDNAGANCIHPDLALCTTTRSAHDVG